MSLMYQYVWQTGGLLNLVLGEIGLWSLKRLGYGFWRDWVMVLGGFLVNPLRPELLVLL